MTTVDGLPAGLQGVVVADTRVGDVRGEEGFYHYRQYSAVELAERRTFEDVWHLLLEGELPGAADRAALADRARPLRTLPPAVLRELPAIAAAGERASPLDALRTAVSLLAADLGLRPTLDAGPDELRGDALRVTAAVPTLIAALWRLRSGREPVAPHPALATAANYLYMLHGEEPDPAHARAVEQYLITTVDHGFNSSTFTARVIASTGADLGAGGGRRAGARCRGRCTAARPAGRWTCSTPSARRTAPRRGCAPRSSAATGSWASATACTGPRTAVAPLRGIAQELGGKRVAFATEVERTVLDVLAEHKPGRGLSTNVEFYAGVVMDACGIPGLFTPTFTASRVVGWCAHVLEQASANRLIRPAARYVAPPPPAGPGGAERVRRGSARSGPTSVSRWPSGRPRRRWSPTSSPGGSPPRGRHGRGARGQQRRPPGCPARASSTCWSPCPRRRSPRWPARSPASASSPRRSPRRSPRPGRCCRSSVALDGRRIGVHVHVVPADRSEVAELRGLRDALRADPDLRAAYAALKERIVAAGTTDEVAYAAAKGDWIAAALTRLGLRPRRWSPASTTSCCRSPTPTAPSPSTATCWG